MRKNNLFKRLMCMLVVFSTMFTFAGCAEEEEELIQFEQFSCSEELRENAFAPEYFYLDNKGFGTKYLGYQMPTVQVDNHTVKLGKTTLGEIYEMFTGVTVEEQIRTARADDEGLMDKTPEEVEAEKKLAEQEEAKKNKKDKNAEVSEIEEEKNPYSFYLKFDDGESRTYAPIYLVSSDLILKATVQIYKYGMPYVQFAIDNRIADNIGIRQESDLIITGVSILSTNFRYADEDGLNSAGKQNVWFDGDNYEYQTMPRVFEEWGLEEKDGYSYNSEYYTRVEDQNFYYYAQLYCYEPMYTVRNVHMNRAKIQYTINRETQKITSLSIWIAEANRYDKDAYDITFDRPAKVLGEDY